MKHRSRRVSFFCEQEGLPIRRVLSQKLRSLQICGKELALQTTNSTKRLIQNLRLIPFVFLLLLSVLQVSTTANGQTTEFTYQGKLTDSSVAANGQYDFQFKLFDSVTGGTQQGSTQTITGVQVTNGIFTVVLKFGSTAFSAGLDRWLEISVKKPTDTSYTTLSPRQKITSAPYSVRSLLADTANSAMTATNATNATNATTANDSLNLNGQPASAYVLTSDTVTFIRNQTTQQASSNFNISGTGQANTFDATTQYNIGGSRVLGVSGSFNLFAGLGAGQSDSSGGANAFVGANAGKSNTTGSNNAFFGAGAGEKNTTGGNNTFVGFQSGFNNLTASQNTFVGYQSGFNNTTAALNTFVGYQAGFTNDVGTASNTGIANTFVGYQAGLNNKGGSNSFEGGFNSFFGTVAGFSNTTGLGNSFFGAGAGNSNTTGSQNSIFGFNAGFQNNSNANSFFGFDAGFNNSDDGNAFFGFQAGNQNTSGQLNTFIGSQAGTTNTTGNFNTLIGQNADVGSNNLSNATAIGARAFVTQSNSLVLGSINGVNGAGADTNVGIGTTAPQAKLHISGSGVIRARINSDINAGVLLTLNNNPQWSVAATSSSLVIFNEATNSSALSINSLNNLVTINNLSSGSTSLCINGSNQFSLYSSSLRYKTNIASFSLGLRFIRQLKPIEFDWKDGQGHDIGFGAEDVEKLNPLFVTYNQKGEVEGVKYEKLTTVLVNAVKEQQEEIETQARQIETLQLENQRQAEKIKAQQAEIEQQKKQLQAQANQLAEQKKQLDRRKAELAEQAKAIQELRRLVERRLRGSRRR